MDRIIVRGMDKMKYTGENPRHNYSEDQFLPDSEYHRLFSEYNAFAKEVLTTDIRDLNSKLYGIRTPAELTDEEERKKRRSAVAGIVFVIVFIGIIVSLVLKQLVIGGIMFAGIFACAGLMLIVTGRANPGEASSASLKNRVMGVFITVVSLAIIGLILLRDRFTGSEAFVWIFIVLFGGSGLGLLTITIINAFSRRLIYRATAEAKCTGYVRKVDYDSSNTNSAASRIPVMYTSPVFEYSYEGIRCRSVYDVFPAKKDSGIALGDVVTINIDPKNPWNVLCPDLVKPSAIIFEAVFSLIFVGVTVFLCIMMANGSVKDMTVETSWNKLIDTDGTSAVTTLRQITDEDIMRTEGYSLYAEGQEWFAEEATVSAVERISDPGFDGYRIDFTDDSFGSVYFPADVSKVPVKGDRFMLFYTLKDNASELDYGYKSTFIYLRAGEGEYVGSHLRSE